MQIMVVVKYNCIDDKMVITIKVGLGNKRQYLNESFALSFVLIAVPFSDLMTKTYHTYV